MYDSKTKTWIPGQVSSIENTPRSYSIKTEHGSYRRNRRDIHQTKEKFNDREITQNLSDVIDLSQDDYAAEDKRTAGSQKPNIPQQPLRRSKRIIKPPEKLNI